MKKTIFYLLLCSLLLACLSCAKTNRNAQAKRTTYAQSRKTAQEPQRTRPSSRDKHPALQTTSPAASTPAPSPTPLQPTEIFEKYNSAVFMIFTTDGFNQYQGSGFFISSDGLAVSNYHVFQGTAKGAEIIKLSDNRTFRVQEVLAQSTEDDFILFRVAGNFNHIPISTRTCRVGEKVYAIGSPKGLENTFSSGEISQIRDENLIQTSCPFDHGSSGGVLLNAYGEAIGITTGGYDDSGANLNFAKDIRVIRAALSRLSITE